MTFPILQGTKFWGSFNALAFLFANWSSFQSTRVSCDHGASPCSLPAVSAAAAGALPPRSGPLPAGVGDALPGVLFVDTMALYLPSLPASSPLAAPPPRPCHNSDAIVSSAPLRRRNARGLRNNRSLFLIHVTCKLRIPDCWARTPPSSVSGREEASSTL